jgi:rhamnosyl/mannosyltransferase
MFMRVLQIGKFYPPVSGGMEIHLKTICEGLRGQVELEALVANTTAATIREAVNGVSLTRWKSFGQAASQPLVATLIFELNRLARAFKPDLVHLHAPNPLAAVSLLCSNLMATSKICLTWHSDIVKQKTLLKLYAPFQRRLLDAAAAILVSSPQMLAQSTFLPNYHKKCVVGSFGIDLARLETDPCRVQAIQSNFGSKPLIVAVGRLSDYKGFDVLIKVMTRIDAQLLIIGEGELKRDLQLLIEKLNLTEKVRLLGRQANAYNFVKACDVFAMPSVDKRETFGYAQVEAMAFSKPVVATRLGSGVEYVNRHGETGILVEPNNEIALGDAILELIRNPELRQKFGANGRKRVEQLFSKEAATRQLMDVYEQILK